jgi:drug/metabolite transporter (DMT)-like permease
MLERKKIESAHSLHWVGVISGLAAGAWLGGAEAPNKLTTAAGLSPFLISLCMVFGVFAARWTVPTMLKGTSYIFSDLREKPHLIVWAVLAGGLWAVANTLSIYAIRDVGLSVAFPIWNLNSLVGLFWGWLFFKELRGASKQTWTKVLGGATAILIGAVLLCYASANDSGQTAKHTAAGIAAALGAAIMWGTMYITYRKAYMSGLNPLSFVTIFVFGELGAMGALATFFFGGLGPLCTQMLEFRANLFWLFLGGFCWVIGDMFQHYAAKYIGISRGIPLSNTNQLWGLAWGALVFGELSGGHSMPLLAIGGSAVMILGAASICSASASASEQSSWETAMKRECDRYGLDLVRVAAAHRGEDPVNSQTTGRRWWDLAIVIIAFAVFVWLASMAKIPNVAMNFNWMLALISASLAMLIFAGIVLWRRTRFS